MVAAPDCVDITAALKPGNNQFTILCERYRLDELGTGGLMGQVVICRIDELTIKEPPGCQPGLRLETNKESLLREAKNWVPGLVMTVLLTAVAGAAERVFPLDLVKQRKATDKVQIREIVPGECEWSLPDGLGQTLHIDLDKLGVDLKNCDELRFDLMPSRSRGRASAS